MKRLLTIALSCLALTGFTEERQDLSVDLPLATFKDVFSGHLTSDMIFIPNTGAFNVFTNLGCEIRCNNRMSCGVESGIGVAGVRTAFFNFHGYIKTDLDKSHKFYNKTGVWVFRDFDHTLHTQTLLKTSVGMYWKKAHYLELGTFLDTRLLKHGCFMLSTGIEF